MGLNIPEHQLDSALYSLEKNEIVTRAAGTNYVLSQEASEEIRERSENARHIEARVKEHWFDELSTTYPELPLDPAWTVLRRYLSRTFRRHGIQAAALLDPSIKTDTEYETSLSTILRESIIDELPPELHSLAARAIPDFFVKVGTDQDRSAYVIQLADGAFNFYTLEVPEDLAKRLQAQLKELTIFLDTNFLFGILDLHYNSQVQVSRDLLSAISENNIPFKLRYHEATGQEMLRTIGHHADILRSRTWTRSLSKAAADSRNLSGIEQKFHESNAGKALDVDEFLRPYEHFDQLLEVKEIKVYRPHKNEEYTQKQIDLYHEYKEFLEKIGRGDKGYEPIMHDATILEQARRLRSDAKTTLDAGALSLHATILSSALIGRPQKGWSKSLCSIAQHFLANSPPIYPPKPELRGCFCRNLCSS